MFQPMNVGVLPVSKKSIHLWLMDLLSIGWWVRSLARQAMVIAQQYEGCQTCDWDGLEIRTTVMSMTLVVHFRR